MLLNIKTGKLQALINVRNVVSFNFADNKKTCNIVFVNDSINEVIFSSEEQYSNFKNKVSSLKI